jgi:hypothetical protein
MRTWTSALVATAILGFAAPAGYAATANIPGDTQSGPGNHTRLITEHPPRLADAKLQIKNKKQAAKIQALIAKNKALAASNKVLSATNDSLNLRLLVLTNPTPVIDPASHNGALECASIADPVQSMDYPESYDWYC